MPPLEGDEDLEANGDEETTRDDQEGGETSRASEERDSEETHRDEANGNEEEADKESEGEEPNREEVEDYQSMLFDSCTVDDDDVNLLREMDQHFNVENHQNELFDDSNAESVKENNRTGDE